MISYSLIRRYDGNLTVKLAPGQGAEFTVLIMAERLITADEETIVKQLQAI